MLASRNTHPKMAFGGRQNSVEAIASYQQALLKHLFEWTQSLNHYMDSRIRMEASILETCLKGLIFWAEETENQPL
ncbi:MULTISPECIES: hypothetical protein [unclassified Leptolyngbya]|uniref:hypothetical protein n=1 Tax=unclassified Leptolyngbya TaxID=2650499 RepID=UPI001682F916|nr:MULTISPECIES: hypothetical protein [unclassified Leptolyngbya]